MLFVVGWVTLVGLLAGSRYQGPGRPTGLSVRRIHTDIVLMRQQLVYRSTTLHLDDDQPITNCGLVPPPVYRRHTALWPLTEWLIASPTRSQLVAGKDKPAVCLIASAASVRPSDLVVAILEYCSAAERWWSRAKKASATFHRLLVACQPTDRPRTDRRTDNNSCPVRLLIRNRPISARAAARSSIYTS